MKKTLLAIGLAVAAMPLTFAAQSPASTPAGQNNSGQTATAPAPTKKVKKVKKTRKPAPASNSSAAPANTSAPASHK
jgi:hypothetical protein